MNTLALPWAKTGQEQPDVGGGGRRPRWLWRGWGDAAERAGRRWVVLV